MTDAAFRAECIAPGRQAVLFHDQPGSAPVYCVIDRTGDDHARTRSLGIALTVAQHLVAAHGEAWICADDGVTARVDVDGVSSDIPDRPWIRAVASAHRTKENP